ncbi:MAG: alpha-L-fucosidase [Limisphaerales bacterium]
MKTPLSSRLRAIVPLVCTLLLTPSGLGETTAERDARMGWFRDARFGLFIHWGVYAVPAGEWQGKTNYGEWFLEETKMPVSQYEKYAAQFNPVQFDAREWARLAREAGMKYVVITSKHHDGFALWDSAVSKWDIAATPFQRDVLKELADACAAEGLRFCFYHSIMDWHHPDWGTRRAWNDKAPSDPPVMDRYVTYMKAQLKELLTGYGPLGILWFDGEWESPWTHERGLDLYQFVRSFQPNIIVNNRVGKGRTGMGGMDQGQGVGDYGTPEQEIPPTGFGPGVDWESCMTMNNHWGFNRHDQNWKSTTLLVRNLIDCASKGGNYLLNVGPTAEGLIPAPSVERLREISGWMKVNREAIHGTTASPFKRLAWGRATQKPGRLYLHVFDWPSDGRLELPLLSKVNKAYLLAAPSQTLTVENRAEGRVVRLPAASPTPYAGVVVLEIEGQPEVAEAQVRQDANGTLTLKPEDAEPVGHGIKIEHKAGVANLGFWTDVRDYVQWPVTISRPGTFSVEATYACEPGSGGSDCAMVIGESELRVTVEPTGGWNDFQTVTVGQITVDKAGDHTVVVKALSKPGSGVANLRSIVLR